MKKRLFFITIAGIVFVSVLGTILHFVFKWSNNNYIVGLFTPTSESTWEHMKLFFISTLLFVPIANYFLKKEYPCIVSCILAGLLAGTFVIPILFYTYSGVLGFTLMWLDVVIFYISAIIAFIIMFKLAKNCEISKFSFLLKIATLILFILFISLSYKTPNLGIFKKPDLLESYKPEDRVVNYVKELSIDVFGNQKNS